MTSGEPNVVALQKSITDLGNQVNDRLDSMVARMDRIDRAVVGEEVLGHAGLVERMGQVEDARKAGDAALHKRLDVLEDRWDRAKWILVGSIFGAGGFGGATFALIDRLFTG